MEYKSQQDCKMEGRIIWVGKWTTLFGNEAQNHTWTEECDFGLESGRPYLAVKHRAIGILIFKCS